MQEQDRIIKINIEEEMKSSYIDYSMSVIVARALPDVRDGLKPVHRRILYGMMELGNTSDKAYKKSARIVGEVLGKYHPHGDSSVYGALVRMAQDWAMRYPLVDGQGNFGSIDGDSAAAMRYTEARLKKVGEDMMQDLYKETVDFTNNFDDTLQEPTVMPTRIPNLLVNGASGIAVGMATNMPTHNLGEVIDACVAYIDNNEIDTDGLMQYVKAPDFPTGGYIYGISGVREAYETGRGRVIMRAKTEIESHPTHDKIIVNEIPYNVNKRELIEHIASLVNEKKIEGISYVNDESDREGMRIVIDVKRDANAGVVLNKLFKMTALQSSFSVNNIALVGGRPKCLTLKDMIKCFVDHRHDVVIRRTKFELRKAKERAHILEGLIIASDNIDEVVRIIRAAKTPNEAIQNLMTRFELSEIQARAIVEMRLRQLTGLMQDQLHAEYEELMKQIAYLEEILVNDELCKKVIKDELEEVKAKYGDPRRSEIVYASEEFNPEDFYLAVGREVAAVVGEGIDVAVGRGGVRLHDGELFEGQAEVGHEFGGDEVIQGTKELLARAVVHHIGGGQADAEKNVREIAGGEHKTLAFVQSGFENLLNFELHAGLGFQPVPEPDGMGIGGICVLSVNHNLQGYFLAVLYERPGVTVGCHEIVTGIELIQAVRGVSESICQGSAAHNEHCDCQYQAKQLFHIILT